MYAFVSLLALVGLAVRAAESQPSEYEIKAAFLANFPKYVDWPASAFAGATSPIVIVILGEHKFGTGLGKLINGRIINTRTLTLKYVATEQEIAGPCHILFISAVEQKRLPGILEKLQGASVLVVGEGDDFLEQGGMINLAKQDNKIRLEVNLTATRSAGLKISSRLLSVADVVKGREP